MLLPLGRAVVNFSRQVPWIAVILLSAHFLQSVVCITWLASGNWEGRNWNKSSDCSRKRTNNYLVKMQRKICKTNLDMMPVVSHASKQTVLVCEGLFKNRRWNCSSLGAVPRLEADLTGGSREQAFVYALSSAALAQSVAKACAIGIGKRCGCGAIPNEPPPGNFKWGGCGDNIAHGSVFSKVFSDAPYVKKKFSKGRAVNMHNNRVGREVVEKSLSTACKCHGVSGSCNIKTCWKGLPDLKVIGATLQQKYALAVEVKTKSKKLSDNKRKKYMVPVYGNRKKVNDNELIYITKSSDYCLPDPSLGSVGTFGRECSKEDSGSGGCQSMCCGRGFTSERVQVKYRCDCKYYWCCYVKCKTCTKTVDIHRCR